MKKPNITLEQHINRLGLIHIKDEVNKSMVSARHFVPRPGYTGIVRNNMIGTIVEYLNELQNKYLFEHKYEIIYKEQNSAPR